MKTHTVSALHQTRGPLHRQRYVAVPAVRLTGKWLAAHGFAQGTKFRVLAAAGTITLEAAR